MSDISHLITTNEIRFEDAVAYFGGKIPVTFAEFKKLSQKYRLLAFTVSGYTKIQVLKKFHDELLRAIEDGETMESFRERMNSFLEDKGYEGMTPFQADTIYRTNVQTAYQVGHYDRMTEPEILAARPYWMYIAVEDAHTRPSHLAMNGRVFPAESSIWDVWYPPNGFRCRCRVITLSRRQVEAMGLTIEEEVPDRAELADGRFTLVLPDHRFATNPAKQRFSPDLDGYPQTLVKAYERMQNAG